MEKAIKYELRRSALQHDVLLQVSKAGRAGTGWKSDEELHALIQSVAREWVGATTKGLRDDTPTEEIIISDIMESFGCPGGFVDRFYETIKGAAEAKFGRAPSRTTVYNTMLANNVKYVATQKTEHAPVIQQHFCRAQLLT